MIKAVTSFLYLMIVLSSCNSAYKKKETKIKLDHKQLYKIIVKDSLLDNNVICKELHVIYYRNGIIKEKGCQGNYNRTGTSVGTWFNYDSLNNLTKKTIFYLGTKENAYKKIIEFYKNGQKKSIKYFKNDMLYEIESDSIKEWKFFDREGNTIKSSIF